MRLNSLAWLLFVGPGASSRASLAPASSFLDDDAPRIAALEDRLASLESLVAAQQSVLARLLAVRGRGAEAEVEAVSSSLHLTPASTVASELQSAATTASECRGRSDGRMSVCVAIPCVPRHLGNLRNVLLDIRLQTVLPLEVVVSLSEAELSGSTNQHHLYLQEVL